jgi:hypothetical protein
MLPTQQLRTNAQQALSKPLDQIFDDTWSSLLSQGLPQQMVQQAVKAARPNAYNIGVSFPTTGNLQAEVDPLLSPGAFGFPQGIDAQLLVLQFSLQSAVNITWHETTSGLFGSWADPSYSATFDGTLVVNVAVPADPTVGLVTNGRFLATNVQAGLDGVSVGNIAAGITFLAEAAWDILTFQSLPSTSIPDQDVPVANVGLQQAFDLLSLGFGMAAGQGFLTLNVQVNDSSQPGWPEVARVEFDLTHPLNPGPVAESEGFGLLTGQPQIGASPQAVQAGSSFAVMGAYFPAQTSSIAIRWTDTTSGPVSQSEIQWGEVLPTMPGKPLNVNVLGETKIPRSGSSDNNNHYTAQGLSSGKQYAFRVRDYDLSGLAATAWGDWLVLTTTATNQVELTLSDAAGTVLQPAATVQQDGTFSVNPLMPAGETAGTYALWATMNGQKVAQTPITVVAKNQQPSAQLEVFNPDTGITVPGVAGVEATYPVPLRGYYFNPGIVSLYIDGAAGQSLGSATANNSGYFTSSPKWPEGEVGPHSVDAVQGGQIIVSTPVWGQNLPS